MRFTYKSYTDGRTYNPTRDWCLVLGLLSVLGICGSSWLAWDYYNITQTDSARAVESQVPKRYDLKSGALDRASVVIEERAARFAEFYEAPPAIVDPSL